LYNKFFNTPAGSSAIVNVNISYMPPLQPYRPIFLINVVIGTFVHKQNCYNDYKIYMYNIIIHYYWNKRSCRYWI